MSTIEIVSGPSREELFDSLRLVKENRQVVFGLKFSSVDRPTNACVMSIEAEDGSGNCWNIKLYLSAGTSLKSRYLKGFYRTSTRTGILET
jgi:hypothetical protein